MKLNHAPQAGLRRRKPGQPDQKMAFWGGVLIHIGVATTMDLLALCGCPPIGGDACH